MIPTFGFACSSSACGPEAALPSAGDGPTAPSSPCALAKLHGAHGCRLDSRQHGIKVRALRFFSVWRPGQRPDPHARQVKG
jgi:nucleoside-diphosphate-sugar epimerase